MNGNLREILDKLAAGEMSADEAERLLSGVPAAADRGPGDGGSKTADSPKYVRIVVDGGGSGEQKVNLKVPLNVVRAGVRLGAMLPDEAKDKMSKKLRAKGIHVDPFELAETDFETFAAILSDLEFEAEGRKGKVRIFVE